jgi:hypothetical protein
VHVDAASERRSSLRKRPMPSKANLFPIFLISPQRRARSSVAERPNIETSVVPFYGTHRLRMPGHSVTVTAWIEVAR